MTLEERIGAAARAIAPLAWAALGLADTLAQESRRKASLRHVRRGLAAGFPELFAEPPTHWIAPNILDRETKKGQ